MSTYLAAVSNRRSWRYRCRYLIILTYVAWVACDTPESPTTVMHPTSAIAATLDLSTEREALAAARDQWTERGLTRYRLVLERRIVDQYSHFREQSCWQDLDINGEQVLAVHESTCPPPSERNNRSSASHWFFGCSEWYKTPEGTQIFAECPPSPMTITEMFMIIDTYLTTPRCGPNGCACDGQLIYQVEYDNELGYPMRMKPVQQGGHRIGSVPCTAAGWSIMSQL